jgi:enoyl-[acyl-carrier protein] reductase II
MWKTKVCEILGIEYPILEGGMAIAGNPELAAAVSNAGGLGMLGSNSGKVEPEKREENLRTCIRTIRKLTDRPFGVNIPIYGNREATFGLLEAAIDEGVRIFATSGGNPALLTPRIKEIGGISIHVVSNRKQAKQAEAIGVDIIVAEGYEAGGANSPDEITTFVIIPVIVDSVNVPVVAAGGIGDSRGFIAALALGADGVQMGSRFIATKECHAHLNYKKAIIDANDTDTVITRRAIGRRVRSLKNDFVEKLVELDQRCASEEMKKFVGEGRAKEGQLLGDVNNGEMSIGQISGNINDILSAQQVMDSIINNADKIIKRCLDISHS